MDTLHPHLLLALAALGLASGFLAGLLGIGGGLVVVPCLTFLLGMAHVGGDVAVKVAIATSMGTILFTSASSTLAHHRRGAIRWPAVGRLAPGIVVGSAIASVAVFTHLKGRMLALVFGLFVLASALQMVMHRRPAGHRELPGAMGQVGAGGVIGFIAGLVGAGGGFLSVPWMTWCNVPMREAVATSAALGIPIAAANVLGYIAAGSGASGLPPGSLGYVWLPALAVLALASVAAAPFGARAAHAIPVPRLRKTFAGMLVLLAGYMLAKAGAS